MCGTAQSPVSTQVRVPAASRGTTGTKKVVFNLFIYRLERQQRSFREDGGSLEVHVLQNFQVAVKCACNNICGGRGNGLKILYIIL